jgi:hypothetical protein
VWHTTGLTLTRKKQRGGVVDTRQVLQRDACLQVHGSRVVVETETHSSGSGSSFGSGSGSANPVIVGNFQQEIRVGLADQPGQLQEELSNGRNLLQLGYVDGVWMVLVYSMARRPLNPKTELRLPEIDEAQKSCLAGGERQH